MKYDEHNNIWASQYMEKNADLDDERLMIDSERLYDILNKFTQSILLAAQESIVMDLDDTVEGFAKEVVKEYRHHKHSDILVMTDNEFVELCKELSGLIIEEIANEPLSERLVEAADQYRSNIEITQELKAKQEEWKVPFALGGASPI